MNSVKDNSSTTECVELTDKMLGDLEMVVKPGVLTVRPRFGNVLLAAILSLGEEDIAGEAAKSVPSDECRLRGGTAGGKLRGGVGGLMLRGIE